MKQTKKFSKTQGRSETLSNQAFEGVKFIAKVNSSDILDISFWRQICDSRMPLSVIYETSASFFWSAIYTQRKIKTSLRDLFRLPYAQKRWFMFSLFRMTWLVLLEGFEWVKPWKFAVVASIGNERKTKKRKKGRRPTEKQIFPAFVALVRSKILYST